MCSVLVPFSSHVEWVRAFHGAIMELQQYVKDSHTTGLCWNPDVRTGVGTLMSSVHNIIPSPFFFLSLSPYLPSSRLPSSQPPRPLGRVLSCQHQVGLRPPQVVPELHPLPLPLLCSHLTPLPPVRAERKSPPEVLSCLTSTRELMSPKVNGETPAIRTNLGL